MQQCRYGGLLSLHRWRPSLAPPPPKNTPSMHAARSASSPNEISHTETPSPFFANTKLRNPRRGNHKGGRVTRHLLPSLYMLPFTFTCSVQSFVSCAQPCMAMQLSQVALHRSLGKCSPKNSRIRTRRHSTCGPARHQSNRFRSSAEVDGGIRGISSGGVGSGGGVRPKSTLQVLIQFCRPASRWVGLVTWSDKEHRFFGGRLSFPLDINHLENNSSSVCMQQPHNHRHQQPRTVSSKNKKKKRDSIHPT